MLRSPEIDSWMNRLSEGTKFNLATIQAMWDSLDTSILERKSLIHATLTSLSPDEIKTLWPLDGESASW